MGKRKREDPKRVLPRKQKERQKTEVKKLLTAVGRAFLRVTASIPSSARADAVALQWPPAARAQAAAATATPAAVAPTGEIVNVEEELLVEAPSPLLARAVSGSRSLLAAASCGAASGISRGREGASESARMRRGLKERKCVHFHRSTLSSSLSIVLTAIETEPLLPSILPASSFRQQPHRSPGASLPQL